MRRSFHNTPDRKMPPRIRVIALLLASAFLFALYSLFAAVQNPQYRFAATQQSSYTLSTPELQGTIYDTNLEPITNAEPVYYYAVIPNEETRVLFREAFGEQAAQGFFEGKEPFLYKSTQKIDFESDSIDRFDSFERYDETAAALIGYRDQNGAVCGLELAYEELLESFSGKAQVQYFVNALGEVCRENDKSLQNTLSRARGGLVLTVDRSIQQICEQIAKERLETGAVIVTEIATGKLRAAVSVPIYAQKNPGASLEASGEPFLNRVFQNYAPGSVLKLLTAACALEQGIETPQNYTCPGYCDALSHRFYCFNAQPHGDRIDLTKAIACSCNGYFVALSEALDPGEYFSLGNTLGFGEELTLSGKVKIPAPALPQEALFDRNTFAALSFGQGGFETNLPAIAQMIAAIAGGGEYRPISMIEGIMGSDGTLQAQYAANEPFRVFSKKTAVALQKAMKAAIKEGTARAGAPEKYSAAAKTGTAQTGIYREDGEELLHFLYAGYYPAEAPRYAIAVIADYRPDGEASPCAAVFREICDALYEEGFIS